MSDDKKSPLDALLDLGLYGPLGLALEARDQLPKLVARGRQQVTSQVTLARMMGQYAWEKDLSKRLAEVQTTLRGLGLLPDPNPPGASSATSPPSPAPGTVPTPPPEVVVPSASNGTSSSNGSASTNGKAAEAPAPAVRGRADLAIPGYDTLSASQVVQRLAGLSPDELEAVRDYEAGTRGRRTILSKIATLKSDASSA